MRVLFVTGGNNPHFQVAPFVMSQAESLRKAGVDVDIFTVRERGMTGYLRHVLPLRRELRRGNYDLVHAHYTFCGWLAWLAAPRKPLVVSYMGSDTYGSVNTRGKRRLKSFLVVIQAKALNFFVDAIIVKSENLLKHILLKRKATLIPNGVDFEIFFPVPQAEAKEKLGIPVDKVCVLFLGNPVDERKNIGLAKEVVAKVQSFGPVKLFSPWPVSPDEVPWWFNAANVLLVTSFLEGSSNVIKEAMACNCPVVSTPAGDARKMLEGVEQCFVAGWEACELAEAISMVLKDGGRSDGREKRSELNAAAVAEQVKNIYRKIMRKS